ncbi:MULTISPECIES: sensor domain-containing diguanylate cyclase [Corallincola]|uniref:diguanylate cyclase n=3 Tax=Corallincola TaxID=1775176 RepID=A0A368N4B6_9GAMM|nr:MULTISPECIES: diguanylate cyclase [Corallincola]RCU45397.1 diguanylate cyclase [Corallincola holothuriorum]TAA41094.1 diguanylate cyclase [Corallincola spongiicola]TCI02745.1 diguanylate cyclase [Corallincola luteus]
MTQNLHNTILNQVNTGVLVINSDMEIDYWNRFLQVHSGRAKEDIVGRNLFDVFPELPKPSLRRKLQGVFLLGTPTFSSWEQRRHLFELPHSRPITTDSEFMAQNCSFLPLKDESGQVNQVCIIIEDATDVCYFQSQLNDTMAKLEKSSRTDGLTQIANRRYWEERLTIEFARCHRHGGELSLIMFDLDKFKSINDIYGHQAGDLVLVRTAAELTSMLRTADLAGRYGGEEFGIVLPDTDLTQAMVVAERIREKIETTVFEFNDKVLPVTISLGVTQYDSSQKNHEKMIAQADAALYKAKESGRNISIAFELE